MEQFDWESSISGDLQKRDVGLEIDTVAKTYDGMSNVYHDCAPNIPTPQIVAELYFKHQGKNTCQQVSNRGICLNPTRGHDFSRPISHDEYTCICRCMTLFANGILFQICAFFPFLLVLWAYE